MVAVSLAHGSWWFSEHEAWVGSMLIDIDHYYLSTVVETCLTDVLLNRRGSYLPLSSAGASLGLPCFVFSHCLFFGRGRSVPHLFVSQLKVSLFLSSLNSHVNNRLEKTEWLVCILGSAVLTQQSALWQLPPPGVSVVCPRASQAAALCPLGRWQLFPSTTFSFLVKHKWTCEHALASPNRASYYVMYKIHHRDSSSRFYTLGEVELRVLGKLKVSFVFFMKKYKCITKTTRRMTKTANSYKSPWNSEGDLTSKKAV